MQGSGRAAEQHGGRLATSSRPKYQVPGEETLSFDFSENDLLQLDSGDFDSSSYFDELPWGSARPGTRSSLFNTDDSELLQIIDSENEALLAALTQTLDDLQEDDLGLCTFKTTSDGGFLARPTSPPNLASYAAVAASPPPSEADDDDDELPILKKLLLSSPLTPLSGELPKEGSGRQQGGLKSRSQRPCLKVEISRNRKSTSSHAQGRSCIELHKHLVSPQHVPIAVTENGEDGSIHGSQARDIDLGDGGGSDSKDKLPVNDSESKQTPLCATGPQFTCEKEQRAVLGLIQYMHTYCLPPRKLPTQDSHGKLQQGSNIIKKAKVHTLSQKHAFSGKAAFARAGPASWPPKKLCSENSILKMLLAQDLGSDVSKPYRLVQPTYTSLLSPPKCKSSISIQREVETQRNCAPKAQMQRPDKVPRKPSPVAQSDCRVARRDTKHMGGCGPAKLSPKQENTIYPVRRSGRLNPELGQWLTFTEDDFLDALGNADVGLCASPRVVSSEEEAEDLRAAEHLLQAHRRDADLCPSLPSSESGSPFIKKVFDQGLTVELCGTAGLTPPTTPPYKPAEDDLFKPDIDCLPVKAEAPTSPFPAGEGTVIPSDVSGKPCRKQPERTELFAHLSRMTGRSHLSEHQGTKRPLSRSFGDHDYCQVLRPDAWVQRKVLKSWESQSQLGGRHRVVESAPLNHGISMHSNSGRNLAASPVESGKELRDLEIRASLTKHFGFLEQALEDVDGTPCLSPSEDTVFEDSGSESSGSQAEDVHHYISSQSKHCQQRSPSRQRSLSGSSTSYCRSRSPANRRNFRCESKEQGRKQSHWQVQQCRQQAIDEGRMVYIRNLSASMSSGELKKRFETFGEITECRVLSRTNKGDKYGFITYRYPENAALSLKNGASLRKRQEPAFQLSYGGLRQFWTRYTDLDSNMEDTSPLPMKSKYETMDFDSLLKEAQRSLQR
ncbi:peroxisome proliferator-activated receptor gamma coactivator 1-beta isoform X2 [Ambystoma mexicanum]|uniref:peroxisome proliferator-activated receptor gamma coactivator 1-beta isoform X2 n=1 Tax=Ambystoma mexicanum TaxID=8296 RepID=UPI0037E864D0